MPFPFPRGSDAGRGKSKLSAAEQSPGLSTGSRGIAAAWSLPAPPSFSNPTGSVPYRTQHSPATSLTQSSPRNAGTAPSQGIRSPRTGTHPTPPELDQTTGAASSGADDHPSPETEDQPRKKKAKKSDSRDVYVRRRSATACQVCRTRKTKCDNQRPVCGTCLLLNVECSYPDTKDYSSALDTGSVAVLDRVNYIIRLLEAQNSHLAGLAVPTSSLERHVAAYAPEKAVEPSLDPASNVFSFLERDLGNGALDHDASMLMGTFLISAKCSSAYVLRWPIFDGKIDISTINDYFFEPNKPSMADESPSSLSLSGSTQETCRISRPGRGVRDEDAISLVQVFLEKVHIKNPILDPVKLIEMAKRVSEEGFKWDEGSCLVMTTCAVANLATEFSMSLPGRGECSYADAKDYSTAEQYYTGARKRMGLLDNSVISAQCAFLLGVYEMYSLRPSKAWLSFSTACMMLQTWLRCSSRKDLGRSEKRMEQRLFWSCVKSECEMRDEIDLVPTGLGSVDYPDLFPSPPGDTPEPEDQGSAEPLEPLFRHSWYYYLSEIAVRRISNRITNELHGEAPVAWLSKPVNQLHRIAQELDSQVMKWSENLPSIFDGEPSPENTDELYYMLKSRFSELRERIWRPFLFIAIHAPDIMAVGPEIMGYASFTISLIFESMELSSIKHRHHGSWYGARENFTKALLILAVAKSGRIALREDWADKIELVQDKLSYWEDEAPDLRMARLVLSGLLEDVRRSQSVDDMSS